MAPPAPPLRRPLYLSKNVALKTHCKFKVIILFAIAKALLKAKAPSHRPKVQHTELGQKTKTHPVISPTIIGNKFIFYIYTQKFDCHSSVECFQNHVFTQQARPHNSNSWPVEIIVIHS